MISKAVGSVPYLFFEQKDLNFAENPSNWKRHSKKLLKTAMQDFCVSSVQEFVESSDETQFLQDKANITEKCVVRHFVIPDLTLDCTVISDELDQNVLAYMLWHQD